ncbi:CBU_0592 family membrane protein [Flavobacterium sp. ZB4P13]|uniref:CBU_0592 family membrane protein n=1 Tax=Flavobacterium sp. ZB4P13 TaxID=3401728 RepID=UPI003AAB5FF4
MSTSEIIGWIGAALFITSYFLLSIDKLDAKKIPYQLMNILGGLCLVIISYDTDDMPNLFTNLIWIFIGFYALVMIVRRQKN